MVRIHTKLHNRGNNLKKGL